jgi:hypothetical protein
MFDQVAKVGVTSAESENCIHISKTRPARILWYDIALELGGSFMIAVTSICNALFVFKLYLGPLGAA